MKTVFLLISFLFISSHLLFAQARGDIRCYTYEMAEKNKKEIPGYAQQLESSEKLINVWIKNHPDYRTRGVITVPVVVHLLYYADSSHYQNISDRQITSEIDAMNEDYAHQNADQYKTPDTFKTVATDCEIQFCLAQRDPNGMPTTGIIRKTTFWQIFTDLSSMKHTSSGGDDAWPYTDYLNIWVCAISGGILGFSTLPVNGLTDEDGCIIHYKAFGRINTRSKKYTLGRTGTHEVGHWFDLYHVWGDDGGTCAGTDSVADTPNQGDANFNCVSFPLLDNCSPKFPGVMYMNYMDYTIDSCMNIFTKGQKARMLATLNVFRSSILNSNGCNFVKLDSLDIGVSAISQPELTIGAKNITPVITLTNFGINTVTSATIYYARNNKSTLHSFNWTGSLASGSAVNVTLPAMPDSNGYQLFIAYTKNPNGKPDADTTNDFKTHSYYVNTNPNGVENLNASGTSSNSFIIYPNPVANTATLKFNQLLVNDITDFQVTNIIGEREAFTWKAVSNNEIEIELPDLPSSLYFVSLRMKNKLMQQKMLIVR